MSGVFQRYIDPVANPAASGRRPRPAGIREVAAAAGVSPTTVSHALNGMGRLSEATRQQVLDVAARLGYRPSQSARALVRGRSDTVGLLWDTGYGATGPLAQVAGHDLNYLALSGRRTSAVASRAEALSLGSRVIAARIVGHRAAGVATRTTKLT